MQGKNAILLDPGIDGTGGGTASAPANAPSTNPETRAEVSATGGQPSSAQPAGASDNVIDRATFDRYQQQVAGHNKLWTDLRSRGITNQQELVRAVEEAQRIRAATGDPRLKGVIEALSQPKEVPIEQRPLDTSVVGEIVRNELVKHQQQQERARVEAEYGAAIAAESRILDSIMSSEAFSKVTGGKGFDDAFSGKAGTFARLFATALNDAVYRATEVPGTSSRRPITDAAAMRQIVDRVAREFAEVKAELLLGSAPSPNGAGTAARPESGSVRPVVPEDRGSYSDRIRRQQELEAGAQDTFREALSRYTS